MTFVILFIPLNPVMEDLKAQLRQLVSRSGVKHSKFALNNELLKDPKVLTAIAGFLTLLFVVYRKSNSKAHIP